MKKVQIIQVTSIPGLYLIRSDLIFDRRGSFHEQILERDLRNKIGYEFKLAQWNHHVSKPNTIRGFHPDRWDKLVRPTVGKLFIAIADIDPLSRTFKKVETFIFNDDCYNPGSKHKPFALFVSGRLGNSVCNFGGTDAHYDWLTNDYWDRELGSGNRGVVWNDPDLAVKWPIIGKPILSEADASHKTLRERFQKDYPHLFK